MHAFDESLAVGKKWESELDDYFSQTYLIRESTRAEESAQGFDRWFSGPDGGVHKVEYKADSRAAETGNAFIETVSVDSDKTLGWALTSRADILIYYIPPPDFGFILRMIEVKKSLDGWNRAYGTKSARNLTYSSLGICVPLWEIKALSVAVFSIGALKDE